MNAEQIQIIQSCTQGSLDGTLAFPDIIARFGQIGVERYHADYTRQEITYYLANGHSLVVPTPHPSREIATDFSPTEVAAAVRQSQRNEHTYQDFLQKTMAAGCVGYFVQITGRRVLYFGRTGDSHIEHFPPAPGH